MRKFAPDNDAILRHKLRRTLSSFTGVVMKDQTERKAMDTLKYYFTYNLKMQIRVAKTKKVLTFMQEKIRRIH